jgi:hypothetical protein
LTSLRHSFGDPAADDAGVGDAGQVGAVVGQELEDGPGVVGRHPELCTAVEAEVGVGADHEAGELVGQVVLAGRDMDVAGAAREGVARDDAVERGLEC